MQRTQFTFYDSFAKAISRIKKKADKADAYDAIINYALYGVEPDLDKLPETAAMAFEMAKPNLDASRRKAESGKRGGTAKRNEAEDKQIESKAEANESKLQANQKQDKEKEQEKEEDKDKEQMLYPSISPLSEPRIMTRPTIEEVSTYCRERKNNVDPQAFIDHYTSNGWKVGRNPMKDWKAAVRTWERTSRREEGGNIFLEMLNEEQGR